MSPEDQQRFYVDPADDGALIWLTCERCLWQAELEPLTLAELNQRADEHTEVCR